MLIHAIAIIAAVTFTCQSAEVRTWTKNSGKQTEAEFVRLDGNKAVLKRAGREVRVSIIDLSRDDLLYLLTETSGKLSLENKKLKRMLADNAQKKTPQQTTSRQSAKPAPASTSNKLTHWITNSSSKRHNSRCRYFKNSRGRMCDPNAGIACKICGG